MARKSQVSDYARRHASDDVGDVIRPTALEQLDD